MLQKMTEKKKKLFWLSYDLGLKGDYSSFYAWLDSMGAKECGNSIASFWFEYTSNYLEELKNSLASAIEISKNYRFYLVWRAVKDEKVSVKGTFLFGKRKPAPWEGYSDGFDDVADEES